MARSKKSYGVKECVICGKEFIPQNDEQMACKTVCANEARIRMFAARRNTNRAKKLTTTYIVWVYHRQMEMREGGIEIEVWRREYKERLRKDDNLDWETKIEQSL